MKWTPVLNASAAAFYIVAIMLFMQYMESIRRDTPDTLLDGVGMLSLLVFSASVMAYLFFYQPLVLLLEHKKKEAASYFLATLGMFGALTAALIVFVSLQ